MIGLASARTKPVPISRPAGDDLSREVFGLLGLPVDAVSFDELLRSIYEASNCSAPYVISTPNVNFVVTSRRSENFRESLLRSELCIADGMPLIWIAKILGIPIRQRVTGADLFHTLNLGKCAPKRLRVFLFGGAEGVASAVAKKLNSSSAGLQCVGFLNPGFCSADCMSSPEIIDTINSSGADLLAVFLGAEKAQTWLLQNRDRITIPLRAQFGAAINFEAGTVRRAPAILRNSGLEWLWRIKEEPYLWRRYWADGKVLTALFIKRVLPLAVYALAARLLKARTEVRFAATLRAGAAATEIALAGPATVSHVNDAVEVFRAALNFRRDVVLDCNDMSSVDPRFIGLILMLRKQLVQSSRRLRLVAVPPRIRRVLLLSGFDFLMD